MHVPVLKTELEIANAEELVKIHFVNLHLN
jgi:hypothetical protein